MARTKKKINKQSGVVYLFRNVAVPLPLFIFILLAAGVILTGWTAKVTGLDLLIKAKIAAPALTQPATILVPVNGDTLTSIPTNISGICPPGSYVKIFRNNVFTGSTLCSDNGTFQLASDLFAGSNKLQAQDYNVTDDAGPSSAAITVTYNPPPSTNTGGGSSGSSSSSSSTSSSSSPSSGSTSSSGSSSSESQTSTQGVPPKDTYILNTDGNFQYSGYFTGQTVQLKLVAGGGTPPYTYDVDWGDGDPVYTIYKDGPFTLTHTYARAGEVHGSHTIKINGADSVGLKTFLQLFVIVNAQPAAATAAATGSAGSSSSSNPAKPVIQAVSQSAKWLWVAWPAYGVVLLMSISYVLGEREELFILRTHRAR